MKKNYEFVGSLNKGWTKQPNAILYDDSLTSDAKVVIYELLSVSGDFHISEAGIASSVHISLERVKKAVKLLKENGYIEVSKVMNNSRLNGYNWKIAYANGTFRKGDFRKTENQATENQATDNPSDGNSAARNSIRSKIRQTENPPIYEQPKGYEQRTMNNEENEGRTGRGRKSEVDPPHFSSPTQSEENILSSGEVNTIQAFNRFCEIYPRVGNRAEAQAAFLAIPDINNICWQIVNSVEWFEKMKRWDDWQSGQKNIYCPQAVKFLERGDWQEFMKSGANISEEDRLRAALAKSRGIAN